MHIEDAISMASFVGLCVINMTKTILVCFLVFLRKISKLFGDTVNYYHVLNINLHTSTFDSSSTEIE